MNFCTISSEAVETASIYGVIHHTGSDIRNTTHNTLHIVLTLGGVQQVWEQESDSY